MGNKKKIKKMKIIVDVAKTWGYSLIINTGMTPNVGDSKMTKKFQITGTVGGGYKEPAYFNPRTEEWEWRSMDIARYDIEGLKEANLLLENASQDTDVSDVKIVEIDDAEDEEA